MLDAILALPLWPFGLLLLAAVGALIVLANVLPLWAPRLDADADPTGYMVSPPIIVWVLLLGLVAIVHWALLVCCLPGLVLSVVQARTRGDLGYAVRARQRDENYETVGRIRLNQLI